MAALAELGVWAIALICLGIAFCITVFVIALLGWLIDLLNLIPKVNLGTGFLHTVEQAVTNAFGVAFGWVDKQLGASIHLLARLTEWLWNELSSNATAMAIIATLFPPLATAIAALRALLNHNVRHTTTQAARVKELERKYQGIEQGLRTLEHEYHGIDQLHVRARLGTLDKELATIEAQTIPAIRQADSDAKSAIDNLYEWAKGKASLLGVGTFATAIAATIGIDAFNGLRCSQWGNLAKKWGCGLGSLLDGLLGLVVSGLILTNICDMLSLLETAYGDVAGPLISFLTEIPLGGCETPPASWAQLHVAAGPLPPPQTLGALPV